VSLVGEASRALSRLRRAAPAPSLDGLLARADPSTSFEERLAWIASLLRWIGRPGAETSLDGLSPAPATRLRHLLNVLDRNPEWKAAAARAVRRTLGETDALELFCETGLPRQPAFLSEALERLWLHVLPVDPARHDLGRVLLAVFPREDSADWLTALDDETRDRVAAAVEHGAGPDEGEWSALRRDLPDALVYLVSEVESVGLSTAFRRRLDPVPFRDLPFFGLAVDAEAVAVAARAGASFDLTSAVERLQTRLWRCRTAMGRVHAHLDEQGVSTRIVYQLERMDAQVRRAGLLLERLAGKDPAPLVARLVRDNVQQANIGALVGRNARLLARKVVERSAETGAHYIARTKAEYASIVRSAAGGGLVTSVTAWLKLGIGALHAPPFAEGFLAAANYAVSFVAIQLAHFTLATKQPAMTAPALARRLEGIRDPGGVDAFVSEAFDLLRSQAASILGNLATVVPGVVAIDLAARVLLGHPLLPVAKAGETLASLSLAGPTPFYAALTGVVLYASSLVAGWADNWFVLHQLESGIGRHPRLSFALGRARAARLARWLRENVSGLAGNVSLGFFLGMTPALGKALGLPLDVRHVTLSAGFLAAAVSGQGVDPFGTGAFAWAVAGLASMAVLNVGVSFALALLTAVRAHALPAPERSALGRAFWSRLWRRPSDLVTPQPEAEDRTAA
jgi:site-specific recombinase